MVPYEPPTTAVVPYEPPDAAVVPYSEANALQLNLRGFQNHDDDYVCSYFTPLGQNRTRRHAQARVLDHPTKNHFRSPLSHSQPSKQTSHQKAREETRPGPFNRESPQESENRTPSPWGQNRTRRRAQRRDLDHSIGNRLRSPKIASEGTHSDETWTVR